MKTKIIAFFLLFIFVGVLATPVPTTIKIGELVTSSGTSEVEVQLNTVRPATGVQLITVTVPSTNSGTIQFSVDETITAAYYAWPAGSKFVVSIKNGISNLRYKASGASQSFVVTQ
jgi:hypothetical protein